MGVVAGCLRSSAADWLKPLRPFGIAYLDFANRFLAKFDSREVRNTIRIALYSVVQKSGEPVELFIRHKAALFTRLFRNGSYVHLQEIIVPLMLPSIRAHVRQLVITDMDHFITKAMEIEGDVYGTLEDVQPTRAEIRSRWTSWPPRPSDHQSTLNSPSINPSRNRNQLPNDNNRGVSSNRITSQNNHQFSSHPSQRNNTPRYSYDRNGNQAPPQERPRAYNDRVERPNTGDTGRDEPRRSNLQEERIYSDNDYHDSYRRNMNQSTRARNNFYQRGSNNNTQQGYRRAEDNRNSTDQLANTNRASNATANRGWRHRQTPRNGRDSSRTNVLHVERPVPADGRRAVENPMPGNGSGAAQH